MDKGADYIDFPWWVEGLLKALIVYSVIMYICEIDVEQTHHSLEGRPFWIWSERIVASVFSIEVVLRWRRRGSSYLFSRMGLIDLISICPFWLGFLLPASALHLVRTMRILRLFKFYRYSSAMRQFLLGLSKARRRLAGTGMVLLILMLFSAVGMYELEGQAQPDQFGRLSDSLWWTTVTFTTVGFGDAYPVTLPGKFFAQVMMILGLGITASFIGIVGRSVYDELAAEGSEDPE